MSIARLQGKIRQLKNPVALGLDIREDLIPPHILEASFEEYGKNWVGLANAYEVFAKDILDSLAPIIPSVKINTAYFQMLGSDGVALMQRLCKYAKDAGYYVIVETMRAEDELSAKVTASTYFGGYTIGGEPAQLYDVDALSFCSFLGSDGIKPFLPYCKDKDKAIFIVAKSSNKSSREVQDLLSGDRVIYSVMTDMACRWGADLYNNNGYTEIGVVVGGTHPVILRDLRKKYNQLFFLVPGYGAQGATAREVRYAFDKLGRGAVVATSRNILGAWKKRDVDGKNYLDGIVLEAEKMRDDIRKYVVVI